jgi:acyl-CoA dehydrogenase
MLLLNPKKHNREYPDERSKDIMLKTIEFFEKKGKKKIKEDDHQKNWYSDFLEFVKNEKVFATLLTPSDYGDADSRWDTWRICELNEILGFYGLCYWYTWQVSILGLGPIWMSDNEELKLKAAHLLKEGAIFAFGLSEKEHGADVYSTEVTLTPQPDGTYVANFSLNDYPITKADILLTGRDAWDAALNTVNVGKYNLGWASIGICTHAMFEAINHAANRRLYNMYVTDFPHVQQMFTEAYARLMAMKLFTLRAADYMRTASPDDRRYLLYNSVVKMKSTTQGEEVITLLWDVIAAKGFEKDMYFEMAARDIQALPRLEGTVHVNIALILKFMPNYFLNPAEFSEISKQIEPRHDAFLFKQGPTKGLGAVQFHDYNIAYDTCDLPNVNIFKEQIEVFKEFLATSPPDADQQKDTDFLMSLGELFTLVVYGQLILENANIYDIENDLIDQIFDFIVRDFSKFALQVYGKPSSTPEQMENCLKMIRKPAVDGARYQNVWENHVLALKDLYAMNE